MHKRIVLALGAGLLAVAALQVPDEVLAKSGSRTVQLKSTTGVGAKVPLTSQLPSQRAPSGAAKRPGGISTEPKAPNTSLCHQPTLTKPTKFLMPSPPSEQFCGGKIVKGYNNSFSFCYHCNGFPPAYGFKCVTCKAGYSWNATKKLCCKGVF